MPSRGEAFSFLDEHGASILGRHDRMVYVGHRSDTHPWWYQTFAPALGVSRLTVVDIFAPNLGSANHITGDLIHGDILDSSTVGHGPGLMFWDEGPEHVTRDQFMPWPRMMTGVGWDVLISCPWGYQVQGPDGANLSEEHHWGPMPADMEEAGMSWRTFGEPFPEGHGNILAWRLCECST